MKRPQLPPIEHILRPLTRLTGFGLFVVTGPSRGALKDAERVLRELVKKVPRALHVWPAGDDAAPGAVRLARVDAPALADRLELVGRLSVARDRLAAQGHILIMLVLEDDLPDIAGIADLWSVRTDVVVHDDLGRVPGYRATALPVREAGAVVSPILESAARFTMLQGLASLVDARPSQVDMDAIYQEITLVGPRPLTPNSDPDLRATAVKAFRHYRTSVIEGDAGSGKTTVLKRIALDLARGGEQVVWVAAPRVDATKLDFRDLGAALATLAVMCMWGPDLEQQPWVLLDGLDELADPVLRARLGLLFDDLVVSELARGAVICSRPNGLAGLPGKADDTVSEAPRALQDLPRLKVQPLTAEQMGHYVESWVESMIPASDRSQQRTAILQAIGLAQPAAAQAQRLQSLCERPLFLSVLSALVWTRGADLSGPAEVLDAFVAALLNRRRGTASGYSQQDLRAVARRVAWKLDSQGTTVMSQADMVSGDDPIDPAELDALTVGTGLLVDQRDPIAFEHAAILDLLLAEEVLDLFYGDEAALQDYVNYTHWMFGERGPLLVELLFKTSWRLVVRLIEGAAVLSEQGEILVHKCFIGPLYPATIIVATWGARPPRSLWPLRDELIARIETQLGDWNTVAAYPIVGWSCAVHLGLFERPLGSCPEWCEMGEGWQVARYPVTVESYAEFIAAGGYAVQRWWSPGGWKWRNIKAISRSKDTPLNWDGDEVGRSGAPVTGLSHHEAAAFVAWYRATRDPLVTLPSRCLWQKAASSAPWGPIFADYERELGFKPQPLVGTAPHLATPEGVEDLGWLVREWLAPEPGAEEVWAGHAWFEEKIPPLQSVQSRKGRAGGRRWYHPYGLRLARRVN